MKVTIEDCKRLREKTNMSVMECKKALMATENDEEKAIEYLKNIPWPPRCILVK